MVEPEPGFTGLGWVVRAHSLKGEIRVLAFSPGAPHLQVGCSVYLAGVRHKVLRAREDRGQWILQLAGLTTRTEAESLRAQLIQARDEDVVRSDEESYFLHELIGLRVVTGDGRELGTISEVLQPGANDVYVVKGDGKEVLIPAIAEVVAKIDLPGGVMIITPLPGLLDESK